MKKIEISKEQFSDDDIRMLCFASEDIINIVKSDTSKISIILSNTADIEKIEKNIDSLMCGKKNKEYELIAYNQGREKYIDRETIEQSGIIKEYDVGLLEFNEIGIQLYECLDQLLLMMLSNDSVIYKKYPTLLGFKTLFDTRYLFTSPQYIHTVSNFMEDFDIYSKAESAYKNHNIRGIIKEPSYSLSPSACFHLYEEIRNQTMENRRIYSMRQNVFRNEGRLNWGGLDRLRDYNVREIVFIGSHDFVLSYREKIIQATISLMKILNIAYEIRSASDSFIMPHMQTYKTIQNINKVKYELRLKTGINSSIACASFNLHGISFSEKFGFSVKSLEKTESGCIGFGLERLMVAFLCQHGCNPKQWPELIRKVIKKRNGRFDNSIMVEELLNSNTEYLV